MRGTDPRSTSPRPLATLLPAIYGDDELVGRFLAGLDVVLAPAISALDCLDAYVDPALAPPDFVRWLGGWVAAPHPDDVEDTASRRLVAEAAEHAARRGTVEGLRRLVTAVVPGPVEVSVRDTGGVSAGAEPGGDLPGSWPPAVSVRVEVDDAADVSVPALEDLVAAACPVHVEVGMEVVAP